MTDNNSPYFSIITVCFNAVDSIVDTIESVLSQSCNDYEYLIIDGGSTDGTVEILKNYSDRIRFVSEPDAGIYDACNKGLALARGKYINILMAGDAHRSDFLDLNYSLLESGYDFSYGGVVAIHEGLNRKINIPSRVSTLSQVYGMPFAHPTLIVSRKTILEIGGYDEVYKFAADFDFICRLYRAGKVGINTEAAASFYTLGGVGNSSRSLLESLDILVKYKRIRPRSVWIIFKQILMMFKYRLHNR